MQDYKNLLVWKKAYSLTLEIHKATKSFPREEIYGLTAQIRRAAASIPSNLAEGCGRSTDADKLRFFDIAMGSTNEVECQLMLTKDLNYLDESVFQIHSQSVIEIKKMLSTLIKRIRNGN